MKIKYIRPGYYNCNYPAGSVVEVDDAYGTYVTGLGEAKLADPNDKISDPVPYMMKVRTSPSEDALVTIANAIVQRDRPNVAGKT